MALFDFMKQVLPKWGSKKEKVRFIVSDTSVLMKAFEHPEELTGEAINEYVYMELGRSIHLPFQEPLIDVYDYEEGDGKATLFAAPIEEVSKFTGLLLDLRFRPEAADVGALCNARLLEHMGLLQNDKTYLIGDWSIHDLSFCIISNGNVEFLRYQSIETDLHKWEPTQNEAGELQFRFLGDEEEYRRSLFDEVLEIDRMMNFFKFSLYKGERQVDEIIVLGDNPLLDTIARYLTENLVATITVVNDELLQQHFPGVSAKYATVIGLALKEVAT